MNKKRTKEDVQYQKQTYNYQQKCSKCKHKSRQNDTCDILVDKDNDVNPNGWCIMFDSGKHVIIDDAEEEWKRARNAFYNEQWRKKKLNRIK